MLRLQRPESAWRSSFLRVRVLVLLLLSAITTTSAAAGSASVNVSVQNTDTEIVYTPFLCSAPSDDNVDCKGGWNATQVGGIPTVSTTGPDADGEFIVPQMFMAFRASALYMSTSVLSNATANFTISTTSSSSSSISREVDTAAGLVAILGLDESAQTALTITYLPSSSGAQQRLDIGSILLTVTQDLANETASFLPSMTLPASETLPTFVPQTSASASASASASPSTTQSSSSSRRTRLALALGLGLCLGLPILTLALFLLWWYRRRRRRLRAENENNRQWF